jgi:TatA/E family protein of Tat protein translocase
MGIGVLEIVILVVIVLIIFGGYKRLPQLGRSAGTGARKGGEKAKELAGQLRTKAEGVDTKKVSESVGKGIREAREVRDTVKGIASGEEPAGEDPKRSSAAGDDSAQASTSPGQTSEESERTGESSEAESESAEGAGDDRPAGR